MTVLEVLRGAENYLAGHGVESARLNAEHLLAHALGLGRMELYLRFDRPVSEAERAPLRETVKRRAAGEPLQHILGTVEFHGRVFGCDRRALVPRPETEQLVEIALGLLRDAGAEAPCVLDVGTGSGVIALTIALECPRARVTATDLSPEALSLARENAARHDLHERIRWEEADLLPTGASVFDLIVANLPYIPDSDLGELSREVRHDPPSALAGGTDGLDVIRRLIPPAAGRLAPGGALLLEIGAGQADAVSELLDRSNFRDIRVQEDYQDVRRFALAFHG